MKWGGHLARHSKLVALEVDQADLLLVTAALVTHIHPARIAAPARSFPDRQEQLVRRIRRQVVVDLRGLEPQRRRYRSVCLDCHRLLSFTSLCLTAVSFQLVPSSSTRCKVHSGF